MDVNPEYSKRRKNGTVELFEVPREDWPPCGFDHLIDKMVLYRWRPPFQLSDGLPSWFDFCLVCYVLKNGARRFVNVDKALAKSRHGSPGLERAVELLMAASLGGYAILADRGAGDFAEITKRSDRLRRRAH